MADLTIQNTAFPAKVVTSPVVYEQVFTVNTPTILNAKVPVDLYLIEISNAEIICSCPIPYLEISGTVYNFLDFDVTVSPYLLIESAVASGDCEDC